MKVVLFSRTGCVLFFCVFLGWAGVATEPPALDIPYTWDFSTWDAATTNYPPGLIGWKIGGGSSSSYILTSDSLDHPLLASSSASTTPGGLHNYAGKIGILDSTSGSYALACAIDTTGRTNVTITYDIMTLRNPFNGTTNTRTNECTLQYRIGTIKNFNLTGMTYRNDNTPQTSGTIPQNPCTQTFTLPTACDNQPVVQLRWVVRDVSGTGSRPSFALGRICVTGEEAPASLQPPQAIRVIGITATSFSLAWEAVPSATGYAIDVYPVLDLSTGIVFHETFDGFDGSGNTNRANMLDDYMQTLGWTGSTIYESLGSIRLGNSTTRGWIQTPQLNVPDTFTLCFDASAWEGTSEATNIDVYAIQAGVTNVLETVSLSKTTRQSYVIQAEASTGCIFGFTAKRNGENRFYLDNLSLRTGWQIPVIETNILTVTSNRATIQGLTPGVRYQGVIRALDGSEQSANSAAFTAKTFNATLIMLN